MRRKTRMVTAQTLRDRRTDFATWIAGATVVLVVTVMVRVRPAVPDMTVDTARLIAGGIVVVGGIATGIIMMSRPKPLVPALARRGAGTEERTLARRLMKTWVRACRDSGLTREHGSESIVSVDCPRIVELRPTPLGLRMAVQPIPGQAAEDVAARADNLASAIGLWLRAEVLGPDRVALTA